MTRSTRLAIGALAPLRRIGMLVSVARKIDERFEESGRASFIEPAVAFVTALGATDAEGFVPCIAGAQTVFVHEDDLLASGEDEEVADADADPRERVAFVHVESEWDLF